jgi:hypothetical protein
MDSSSIQTVRFAKAYRAEQSGTGQSRTSRSRRGTAWARWRGRAG